MEQTTFEGVRDYIYEDPEWLYELVKHELDFIVDGIADCEEPDTQDVEYVIYRQLIDILVNDISWGWDREEGEPNTKEDKAYLKGLLKKVFDAGFTIDFLTKEILYDPKKEGLYRFRFDSNDKYRYFFLKKESHGTIRYWESPLVPEGKLLRIVRFDKSLYVDSDESEFFFEDNIFNKVLMHSEPVELPKMDKGIFVEWLYEDQPVCMDCGLPVTAWYRDGDCDRYRCESCQWKAYTEEEWDKLCEDYEDECYFTDLY